jgi:hypothetical protein
MQKSLATPDEIRRILEQLKLELNTHLGFPIEIGGRFRGSTRDFEPPAHLSARENYSTLGPVSAAMKRVATAEMFVTVIEMI